MLVNSQLEGIRDSLGHLEKVSLENIEMKFRMLFGHIDAIQEEKAKLKGAGASAEYLLDESGDEFEELQRRNKDLQDENKQFVSIMTNWVTKDSDIDLPIEDEGAGHGKTTN